MKPETNNEQLILEAAEAEFLDKGYHNTKTTVIAEKAGVTHAMLHYYFRTKENLFNVVFQNKLAHMADLFGPKFNVKAPFEEVIRSIMESQFDAIAKNPQLMNFVYNESIANEGNKEIFIKLIVPSVLKLYNSLDKLLQREIAKGTVRPIKTLDLIINMAALNTLTFKVWSIIDNSDLSQNDELINSALQERRENNVQFILNAVKL